jgi:hypothetical protein
MNATKIGEIRFQWDTQAAAADNGLLRVEANLRTGELFFRWADGRLIAGCFGETVVGADRLRTVGYPAHRAGEASVKPVRDGFGRGVCWTVEHASPGKPALRHRIWCYERLPYAFVELEAEQQTEWETREISPLTALQNDGAAIGFGPESGEGARVLFVPFDNDKWVRYASHPLPGSVESCEVTAIYRPDSRRGFVLGSVTHDFWKTGVRIESAMPGEISRLRVYGGAAGLHTRDTVPHGAARGATIVSPRIFVGAFDDYRDGLETYGRANAAIEPKLPWDGGVPFGWNSWSAVMDKLDLDVYVRTSDFIRRELQNGGFENGGAVYINFDAFWTNLSEDELREAVRHVRENGQKPGIYYTPFSYWGRDPERPVEGCEGRYVYRDLLLKDENGRLLPTLAGAYAIDPSHPAALERIKRQLETFVAMGFEYVKLDFLTHGALEGKHYLPEIRSGIQAYRLGMGVIRDTLAPERIGRPFFINLSIAPLFPHGYAHSRRISCDAFGLIRDTEYMLNAVTYGWWINNTLYRFNDPDHTVLYQSANQPPSAECEGRSRLTASLIAGTSLLLGDDYRIEAAADRARSWMTRADLLAVARRGVSFRPAEGAGGNRAEDVFVLRGEQQCWVAVFNFDDGRPARKRIAFDRIGVPASSGVRVTDLWDGADASPLATGEALEVELQPAEAKLLHLRFDAD